MLRLLSRRSSVVSAVSPVKSPDCTDVILCSLRFSVPMTPARSARVTSPQAAFETAISRADCTCDVRPQMPAKAVLLVTARSVRFPALLPEASRIGFVDGAV